MRKRWWAGKSELVRHGDAEEIEACRGQETSSSGGAAAPAPAQKGQKGCHRAAKLQLHRFSPQGHREASVTFPSPNFVVKGLLKVKAQVCCCSEAFLLILKSL